IENFLAQFINDVTLIKYLATTIMIVALALLCIIANFVTKKVLLKSISFVIKNNKFNWDDYLLDRKVFHKLSHIVPAIIIYFSAMIFPQASFFIIKAVNVYVLVIVLLVLSAFLDAANDIYCTFEISKAKPIKGYIQVAKIVLFFIGGILFISSMFGVSPL